MNLKGFLFLVLILITTPVLSQKKLIEKKAKGILIERGYLDKNSLKTGKWENFFRDGNISKIEHYKKGKSNGTIKEFYPNGQLKFTGKKKDGVFNGKLISYHENGVKKSEGKNKGQKRIGIYKSYYQSGVLMEHSKYDKNGNFYYSRSYYSNGKPLWISDRDKSGNSFGEKFNEKGVVVERVVYQETPNSKSRTETKFYDTGIIKEILITEYENDTLSKYYREKYNENGKLTQEHLIDGKAKPYLKVFGDSINEFYYLKSGYSSLKEDGYLESHYLNGQVAEQGYYKSGKDGVWKSFYSDGTLKFVGKYIADSDYTPEKKDSIHTYYYSNGNIERIEFYKAEVKNVKGIGGGILVSDKIGTWKTYYKNGQLKETTEYNDDRGNFKQGKYFSYYENGNIHREGTFSQNELKGEFKTYYKNGNLQEVVSNYRFGAKNGLVTTYYENGVKESEIIYDRGVKHGKFIKYFENGEIKKSGICESGKEDTGVWEYYYKTGNIAQKIIYSDDEKLVLIYYPNKKQMVEIRTSLFEKYSLKNIKVFNELGEHITFNEFASLNDSCEVYYLHFSYNNYQGDIYINVHYTENNVRKEYKKTYY